MKVINRKSAEVLPVFCVKFPERAIIFLVF